LASVVLPAPGNPMIRILRFTISPLTHGRQRGFFERTEKGW
jgi:hypothetical protein